METKFKVRRADVADGIQWWAVDDGICAPIYFADRMAAVVKASLLNSRVTGARHD